FPDDLVSGAITSIIESFFPHQIIVGTVNGGIWRTTNPDAVDNSTIFDPQHVQWVPLTDQYPGLSISSLAVFPGGFVAGIGSTSSDGRLGGAQTGILRSIDGGNTWQVLGSQAPVNPPAVVVNAGAG